MIQRIQSLLLILGVAIGILLLFLTFRQIIMNSESDVVKTVEYNLFHYSVADEEGVIEKNGIPFSSLILVLIISTAALVNIFMYRKRSIQSTICRFLIVLSSALIVSFIFDLDQLGGVKFMVRDVPINYLIIALPVLMIILFFLANKAIVKDEKLIRSAERIR